MLGCVRGSVGERGNKAISASWSWSSAELGNIFLYLVPTCIEIHFSSSGHLNGSKAGQELSGISEFL